MDLRVKEYQNKLSAMIGAKTVSSSDVGDGTEFGRFRGLLKELFKNLFAVSICEDFGGSMLLIWRGRDSSLAPIMLMNHHDVVDAHGDWRFPPFSGTVSDGRIWGRGALDTKGGLFAMLEAADGLAKEGFVPSRDVYFVSTANEETTGEGADAISSELMRRGLRFKFVLDEGGMILHEPLGGVKGTYAIVGVGEKGDTDLKFTARSHGGHASTPGKNTPLVRLGKFMAAADKKKLFKPKLSETTAEMLRAFSKSMTGPLKFVFAHPRLFAPLLVRIMPKVSDAANAILRTTLAFTMASGSEGANVLPDEAWVIGNMRYSHHQGAENSIAEVKKLAQKYEVETEIIQEGFSSPLTDYESSGFALIRRAVSEIFEDVKTTPYVMTAASDCRYMSRISDCCLRFTPFLVSDEQLAGIHGIDENISVSALAPAVDFYKFIITEA